MTYFHNATCRTSVPIGDTGRFKQCGKPATESVAVGVHVCHYCEQHAAAARRFVERQGVESIKDMQRQVQR